MSERTKGLLNAAAIGIILFLIIDVLATAWTSTVDAFTSAPSASSFVRGGPLLAAMFVGLAVGLVGLARYERGYLGVDRRGDGLDGQRLATMIAAGIGAHNLSEGLAIGQSYAAGATALALVLIIGFGAHNATEGFGIAAPLTNAGSRPPLAFLVKIGLLGGGPTFVGTILGSAFYSPVAYVLFLSLAGGALVYVAMVMYTVARRQTGNDLLMVGAFIGLCAGFLTDLIISLAG